LTRDQERIGRALRGMADSADFIGFALDDGSAFADVPAKTCAEWCKDLDCVRATLTRLARRIKS
jgi:hypothetical protein